METEGGKGKSYSPYRKAGEYCRCTKFAPHGAGFSRSGPRRSPTYIDRSARRPIDQMAQTGADHPMTAAAPGAQSAIWPVSEPFYDDGTSGRAGSRKEDPQPHICRSSRLSSAPRTLSVYLRHIHKGANPMNATPTLTKYEDLPCCPELDTSPVCDVIDMRRRLVFPTHARASNERPVRVEVIFHTRFTRCSGPLALGDPVYPTTLLPGEQVRLATTYRRSQ